MDGPCDEFFACAGFAGDEDRVTVAESDEPNHFERFRDGFALADNTGGGSHLIEEKIGRCFLMIIAGRYFGVGLSRPGWRGNNRI